MEKTHRAGARRQLTLLPLIAATFFMVSGGPYGLEELVQKAGYHYSILILIITPILWSLPTALMLGELSSAIPVEGGFYIWVSRALGPFWGFQEIWLSLAASIFDMAIYPTLFILYLARLWPWAGDHPILVGGTVIALCAAWNLTGARAVGESSVVMTIALLCPFLVMMAYALMKGGVQVSPVSHTGAQNDMLGGILIAMWNYMGWDNSSTVAGEVENPQKTYPRAMIGAVTLVGIAYVLPVLAVSRTGIDPSQWTTGAWVEAAGALAGKWLGIAIVLGGMVCGIGMFNALVMSYTRLPMVLAEEGYLPLLLARKIESTGAPWVSVIACSILWTLSLGLSFERLVLIDVLLYGLSLVLEFVALVFLRLKEPDLPRPFKVPGGLAGAITLGVMPTTLILIALVRNRSEQIGEFSALNLGLILIFAGPVVYLFSRAYRKSVLLIQEQAQQAAEAALQGD